MNAPHVSIIVPVYQSEKSINACIDSILGQSYSDFELLLIDDGSTDRSGLICDHYAQADERVKVIHKKNAGVSAARNSGLDICCGKYIAFIDSDDTIDKGFLKCAVNTMQDVHSDIFISGFYMETWKNGSLVTKVPYGIKASQYFSTKELLENMDVLYPQLCVRVSWCNLYKAKIIRENHIRFTEMLRYGEDNCFNFDFLACCKHVFFSQEIFYHYRCGNEGSLTGKFHRDIYEVNKIVFSKMRDAMYNLNCCELAMNRFEAAYFVRQLSGIHEYYRFHNKTTRRERYRQIVKLEKDSCIFKTHLRDIKGWKNRILLILLRLKLHWAILLIFEIRYRCLDSLNAGLL